MDDASLLTLNKNSSKNQEESDDNDDAFKTAEETAVKSKSGEKNKYTNSRVVHFSRGRASRKLNKWTNVVLLVAIAFITLSRCITDPDLCDSKHMEGESTTLSYIIDKSWMAMFAMAVFTLGCCVHIFMAWWVYYPNEPFRWSEPWLLNIVTVIRVLHTVVFFHGFLVGIFRVGEAPTVHYGVATVLFAAAGVETTLILYRAMKKRPYWPQTTAQALLWVALTAFFVSYLVTEIGWFELTSLALLTAYYIFLNFDMASEAEVECIVRIPTNIEAIWRLRLPKSLYRIK